MIIVCDDTKIEKIFDDMILDEDILKGLNSALTLIEKNNEIRTLMILSNFFWTDLRSTISLLDSISDKNVTIIAVGLGEEVT